MTKVQELLSMPLQLWFVAETGFFPSPAPCCSTQELGSTALSPWLIAPSLFLAPTSPASGLCKKIPFSFRISICVLGCWGRSSAYFSCVPQFVPNSPQCWVSPLPIPFSFLTLQDLSSPKNSQNVIQQPFLCCACCCYTSMRDNDWQFYPRAELESTTSKREK